VHAGEERKEKQNTARRRKNPRRGVFYIETTKTYFVDLGFSLTNNKTYFCGFRFSLIQE